MQPRPHARPSRLGRVLGLLVLLGLPMATLSPVASEVQARTRSVPGALPVTTVVNDPRCGPGLTSVGLAGQSPEACFHTAADPMPQVAGPLAQAKTAAPVCLGNGVNGPRVQLIYVYVEGQADRSSMLVPRITKEFVPRMEGVFRSTSREQGREIGMRLHMPDCQLTVDTVMIDAYNGAPDSAGPMAMRIANHLVALGYDSSDRKYQVWFDGPSTDACGVAIVKLGYFGLTGGDNPLPTNDNNIGWQSHDYPEVAVTFQDCWGRGATGARTEIHELIHLLGAVNFSAPNNNGVDLHCIDHNDIMCQPVPGGKSLFLRCATPVEQLDCGSDDYFNARAPVGSYLSTHWNTANSRFLGDAIVHDNVPVEIPRP